MVKLILIVLVVVLQLVDFKHSLYTVLHINFALSKVESLRSVYLICKAYAYIVKHNYVLGGTLFTILYLLTYLLHGTESLLKS